MQTPSAPQVDKPTTPLEIKQEKFIKALTGYVLRARHSDQILTAQLKAVQEGEDVDFKSKVILNAPDNVLEMISK